MKYLKKFENLEEPQLPQKTILLCNGARNNEEFKTDITEADPDDLVLFESDDLLAMSICAGVYYGWLLGKYGPEWENSI